MVNPAIHEGGWSPGLDTGKGMVGELAVSPNLLSRLIFMAGAVVILLGIGRELTIAAIGTQTALNDLRHFAFDAERSLPAWYESLLMALCAGLLAMIGLASERRDGTGRWHWLVLAAMFLAMSADETVSFHEATMEPLRQAFGFSGFLHFAWVVIAAPVLVVAALFFLPFLRRLPQSSSVRFVVAGVLFVGGAFGLEFVGGYFVSKAGFDNPYYIVTATLEECLEIIGLSVFAAALLRHIGHFLPGFRLTFQR